LAKANIFASILDKIHTQFCTAGLLVRRFLCQ
jgi:hypothetical protein